MPTKRYTIDPSIDHGDLGMMIITDAQLLLRPAQPGQYHKIPYDVGHAISILGLSNDEGAWARRIISHENPDQAERLLDGIFHAYIDSCCLELRCDARVNFIQDDEIVSTKEYGFEDGVYTMTFNVYCGISPEATEDFLNELLGSLPDDDVVSHVVVRPDLSELGFIAHGTVVHNPDLGIAYDA